MKQPFPLLLKTTLFILIETHSRGTKLIRSKGSTMERNLPTFDPGGVTEDFWCSLQVVL